MSLYKMFKTDEDIEKAGVLLEYGVNKAGNPITIRIARAGGANAKFQKALEFKSRPYRRQIQNETIDPKVAQQLFLEVYAESVVLGWENVEFPDGSPMPFTKENCIKLFTDLPELFNDLREQAQKTSLFRTDILEADSGN